jgi:2-polyprenyl-3-methyl-5-hydroxy-6-metoxy-1,4-benzoquinol methylase
MINYTQCPVCDSANIAPALTVQDYTVSQQKFAVWHCSNCALRFTQQVPPEHAIGPYYKSDTYISHSDTKKGFINSLYHLVRKRTLQAKQNLITTETGIQQGTVLDIGCGTGAFLHTMQTAGWQIMGLEPDDIARAKAKELYNLQPQSPENLFNLPAQYFNAITMWHVLEHVHELHAYIKQLAQIVKPGGKIFVAVPNYTSKDAATYGQYWAAYDVPRHLYHFSPSAMRQLLAKHGLRIKAIKPMWFDSFYVCMLSEQYKNGKGNIIKAFWNGFVSNCKAFTNKERCSSIIYIVEKAQ